MVNYTNYILIKSLRISAWNFPSYGLPMVDTFFPSLSLSIFSVGCYKTHFAYFFSSKKLCKAFKIP